MLITYVTSPCIEKLDYTGICDSGIPSRGVPEAVHEYPCRSCIALEMSSPALATDEEYHTTSHARVLLECLMCTHAFGLARAKLQLAVIYPFRYGTGN